jgi:hypothetical protein
VFLKAIDCCLPGNDDIRSSGKLEREANYNLSFSYNFCWSVRTLRVQNQNDRWLSRTPAMVAGLTDHIWSLSEWLTYPAVQLT